MRFMLSAEETRELRLAVIDRAETLRRIRKGLDKAQLSTDDVDMHILILLGSDSEPGLSGRLSEQLTVFQGEELPFPPEEDEEAEEPTDEA